MAKKKKAKKKLHRSHSSVGSGRSVRTSAAQAAPKPVTGSVQSVPTAPKPVAAGVEAARWTYVGGDVRRIGILASSCIVAELIIWYLFNHTGLGTTVYSLVK